MARLTAIKTEPNLTNMESIIYLLTQQGGEKMKGTVRAKGKCNKCKGNFELVDNKLGYICLQCKVIPTRFFIDLHHEGKRVRIFSDKTGQVLDSYQRAAKLLSTIDQLIDDHSFDPSKFIKAELERFWTKNLLDKFLTSKLNSLAPSYTKDFERMIRIAKDFFRMKDARDIRKIDIVNYKEHLEKNFSLGNKSIKNILDVFKTFMRYLMNDLEIIDKVPPFPIVDVQAPKTIWLHAEDQITLFELIPEEHKPIMAFLMLHGCRPSEARALKCKDIDLKNKSMTIYATFSNGIYREKRKGKRSTPVTIPIHPEMYDFIQARVKNNLPEAYIFINPKTGSYYRESFLKRIWQSVRTKAGISNTIRLYDATRHSFGSQLVNSNVPIYTVSKLLGHSSIKTTERYCHSHIENLRINMNKISLKPISTVTKLSPEKRRQRKSN